MMDPDLLLPVAAMMIGLISLSTSPDISSATPIAGWLSKKTIIILLVILQISVCIMSISSSISETDSKQRETKIIDTLSAEVVSIKQIDGEVSTIASRIDTHVNSMQNALSELVHVALTQGYTSDTVAQATVGQLTNSLNAVALRDQIATEAAPGISRKGITIDLFAKNIDHQKVSEALAGLGFTIITRQPLLPNAATNAVFYARDTPPDAVKLVALTLIGAGLSIQVVEPLRPDYAQACKCSIQVGSDLDYTNSVPITLDQINKGPLPLGAASKP